MQARLDEGREAERLAESQLRDAEQGLEEARRGWEAERRRMREQVGNA